MNAFQSARWHREAADKAHGTLTTVVRTIRNNQQHRRELDLRHARLYGNFPYSGFGIANYLTPIRGDSQTRLCLNVVKNMCDTATSRMIKARPKPTFLTSGGDYSFQRKAKLLDKFVEGQFYETSVYAEGAKACQDATIFGTGVLKVFRDGDSIKVERVFPWEVLVDEAEAIYGAPRSYYQRKYVDRYVLAELFPEHRGAILSADRGADDEPGGSLASTSDTLIVHEAWHLPSGPKADDGRHAIVIDNATLLFEDYKRPDICFVFVRWSHPPLGFWGVGIAEQLTSLQFEINKLLIDIARGHHLIGKSHWIVDNASKVVSAHLDNDIGSIIRYSGGIPPHVYTPQVIPPEIYQHLWSLVSKAYEITGVSQFAAQSQKPAGLNSGRALIAFNDMESDRFVRVGREYEQLYLDVAKRMISLAAEISEDGGYSVRSPGKSVVQAIRWNDINLTEDEYVMKIFPTSALANDPPMRMQQVENMANAGWIDAAEAKRLLDFPDLEHLASLEQANHDLIERMVERMLDRGEYIAPEPLMDLDLAEAKFTNAYLKAKLDDVPEENRGLLRRAIAEVVALKADLQQQAAPQAASPPPVDMPQLPAPEAA